MNNFCLLPQQITKLKEAFKEQKMDVIKLMKLSPEARTEFFSKYAGEQAKDIELAFQQKLILKHDVQGVVNLLSKLTQSGKYSPETIAKLEQAKIDFRAKQQERIFSPKEKEAFYEQLAEKAFGGEITEAESKQLYDLGKQKKELFKKYNPETREWTSLEDRAKYGAAGVLEINYMAELKGEGSPWREIVSDRIDKFKTEDYKPRAVLDVGTDALTAITNNSIALVASMDNSFLGRQGINVLMTHPSVWFDGAQGSFLNMFKELGGQDAMNALMADVISRPNYINGEYKLSDILTDSEEAFPTSLPEQVPGLGRVFKASEVAFKGSAISMRTGLYDLYSDAARNGGIEMNKVQIQDIGKVVNSLTARGKWGKKGDNALVRVLLWAPRMMKANLDLLTAHGLGTGLKTPFARKLAFKNSAKIIGILAITLASINAILKKKKVGGVEFNPLSSDFGKVIVYNDGKLIRTAAVAADFIGISTKSQNGKTTFDITGGKNSYVTLVARQLLNRSKSASTGITTSFGTGFGAKNRFLALIDFLSGKTVPITGAAIQFATGTDYNQRTPTIKSVSYRMFVPISVQNILGIFGVGQPKGVDWNREIGAELQAFKDKIGNDEFKKANKEFNDKVEQQLEDLLKSDDYKAKSDEDKQKAISKLKDITKSDIFISRGFVYKKKK